MMPTHDIYNQLMYPVSQNLFDSYAAGNLASLHCAAASQSCYAPLDSRGKTRKSAKDSNQPMGPRYKYPPSAPGAGLGGKLYPLRSRLEEYKLFSSIEVDI